MSTKKENVMSEKKEVRESTGNELKFFGNGRNVSAIVSAQGRHPA